MAEHLDKLVAALAKAARNGRGSNLVRIELDVQDSGEVPYRLVVRDDVYPEVGLANIGPYAPSQQGSTGAEREVHKGSV